MGNSKKSLYYVLVRLLSIQYALPLLSNVNWFCTSTKGEDIVIKKTRYGVPHSYANSTHNLPYKYGYAVEQDRLFQMKIAKIVIGGRVAHGIKQYYQNE